jgi:hypothetical protein
MRRDISPRKRNCPEETAQQQIGQRTRGIYDPTVEATSKEHRSQELYRPPCCQTKTAVTNRLMREIGNDESADAQGT